MTGRPRSTAPRRTEVVKILVTPELDALVTAAAKREGRSVSDWGQRLFDLAVSGAWARRAKNARMTPIEWLRHCIKHDATPMDQTPAAQRRYTAEASGID